MMSTVAKMRLATHLNALRLLQRLRLMSAELFYVGSSDVLPPPLSSDEESHLLERLSDGDATVKTTLIERNLRLVVYIARKFENTGVFIEDLVSIGAIGLIKAVNTFDPSKKIKLATYASRCIENEILMYLRRNNKTKAEISFDEPLNTDWDGNELLLSDVLGQESDVIRYIEEEVDRPYWREPWVGCPVVKSASWSCASGLMDGQEKTQKEVADVMGISQSYISRLEKRILKKLRREIKRME